jgi:hypothetical protein
MSCDAQLRSSAVAVLLHHAGGLGRAGQEAAHRAASSRSFSVHSAGGTGANSSASVNVGGDPPALPPEVAEYRLRLFRGGRDQGGDGPAMLGNGNRASRARYLVQERETPVLEGPRTDRRRGSAAGGPWPLRGERLLPRHSGHILDVHGRVDKMLEMLCSRSWSAYFSRRPTAGSLTAWRARAPAASAHGRPRERM